MPNATSVSDEGQVRAAALLAARRIVTARLIESLRNAGMAMPADVDDITAALTAADPKDPRWVALSPYRLNWSLEVLTLVADAFVERRGQRVRTPDVDAVAAALDAGATWTQIGDALSSTPPAAHERYRQRLQA